MVQHRQIDEEELRFGLTRVSVRRRGQELSQSLGEVRRIESAYRLVQSLQGLIERVDAL